MTVAFILSSWGNAHQLSRVLSFQQLKYQLEIFAFDRSVYPSGVDLPVEIIGKLKAGSADNRIRQYTKALKYYFKIAKNYQVVYIFGFDNLLLFQLVCLCLRKSCFILYEVADIHKFQLRSGILNKLVKLIDKRLMQNVGIAVLTSQDYYDSYYSARLGLKKLVFKVIENKVHTKHLRETNSRGISTTKLLRNGKLTIGYFGLLRCERSLNVLIDGANKGYWQLVLRGRFMENTKKFRDQIENKKNVEFLGTYVSPNDLETMYSEIDLSWTVYPYSEHAVGNWRWARTNRYYEAGFYKTPIIASHGTADARNVEKYGLGLVVDLTDIKKVEDLIKNIQKDDLIEWEKNLQGMPESAFEITDEYQKLDELINHHIGKVSK